MMSSLDVKPVRETGKLLPYGRQWIDEDDIKAVIEVLKSDWLTTGPKIEEFEGRFASFVGTKQAVAVSSGTAALHCAMCALGIGPGDEVIIPAMTFAATANCVVFQGGDPVFADVEPGTLLMDASSVESRITDHTRAIIAVDYAGQACDYDALQDLARKHCLHLVDDACHALGGKYKGRPVGSLADISTFSFHPVKNITSGEGGIVTTDNVDYAQRIRRFRNHGIFDDHQARAKHNTWLYEIVDLGYNYRLTEFQCALAMNQLAKLSEWVIRRQEIAKKYDDAFAQLSLVNPLSLKPVVSHAYHLYVVRLRLEQLRVDRDHIFKELRELGIGVNVHYIPVHLHPYYRKNYGTGEGQCPVGEKAYSEILTLPVYPKMENTDVDFVIETVLRMLGKYER